MSLRTFRAAGALTGGKPRRGENSAGESTGGTKDSRPWCGSDKVARGIVQEYPDSVFGPSDL